MFWSRINHDTLRDGWVLKFPSPKAGPADWASPAVLFGENEMTLPNGATGAPSLKCIPMPARIDL